MPLIPAIKMGILGPFPTVKQALVTWAWSVVPSDVPLRGPEMSRDMRLWDVSIETPESDESECVTVGLIDPLG